MGRTGAGEAHSARCLLLHVLAMAGTAVGDIIPLGIWRTALVLKGGRYDAAAGVVVENTAEYNFCRAFVRGSHRLRVYRALHVLVVRFEFNANVATKRWFFTCATDRRRWWQCADK